MNSFFIKMMTHNSKYPKKVSTTKTPSAEKKITDEEYKKYIEKQRSISCFMGGAFNVKYTANTTKQ